MTSEERELALMALATIFESRSKPVGEYSQEDVLDALEKECLEILRFHEAICAEQALSLSYVLAALPETEGS